VTIHAFFHFSSLSPFGSRGIGEGFCVPFLFWMCMIFIFFFIFRFMILVASILHSKYMPIWAFDFSHVHELGLLSCQGFDKSSREGIFQVAPEVILTEWNVDTNIENSGPILERMERTICFSSLYISTPQALSCDNKSLNFVNKYWILSKLFGSNVRSSTYNMCPLISYYFKNIPSKVDLLHLDSYKNICEKGDREK
jgi:hypothetical protein